MDLPQAPIACNMAGLDAAARDRRHTLARRLGAMTREIQEQRDGYAFRYPADELPVAAEFVSLERRCCPFFRFVLTLAPNDGPLWLSITGQDGVKAFLVTELGDELGLNSTSGPAWKAGG